MPQLISILVAMSPIARMKERKKRKKTKHSLLKLNSMQLVKMPLHRTSHQHYLSLAVTTHRPWPKSCLDRIGLKLRKEKQLK